MVRLPRQPPWRCDSQSTAEMKTCIDSYESIKINGDLMNPIFVFIVKPLSTHDWQGIATNKKEPNNKLAVSSFRIQIDMWSEIFRVPSLPMLGILWHSKNELQILNNECTSLGLSCWERSCNSQVDHAGVHHDLHEKRRGPGHHRSTQKPGRSWWRPSSASWAGSAALKICDQHSEPGRRRRDDGGGKDEREGRANDPKIRFHIRQQ